MPAMAADGGPTPTIAEYSGAENPNAAAHATTNPPHKQERSDFRLLVTFDALVEADLDASGFTVSVAEGIGKATATTTASGITNVNAITLGANAGKAYMVTVNLTTTAAAGHTADAYSFGYISFVVIADQVDGTQAGHSTNGLGNVRSAAFEVTTRLPKANDWTVTPTIDASDEPEITAGKLVASTDTVTNTFKVDFTLSGGTGNIPELENNATQLKLKDSAGMDITAGIAVGSPARSGLVASVTYTVSTTAADIPALPIFVGVNPNWANGPMLQIPAAGDPPKKEVAPTVDIALFGVVNETAKTFEVKFTFEKATVDAATQTAAAVPGTLVADQITLQKQDPDDATMMIDSDAYVVPDGIIKTRAGVFLVTVNYRADALPVYVGTDVTVSATTIGGMALGADDDPVLKVGMEENAAPVFKPTAATSITGMVGTAITAADVSATDADNDTLTYSWDVTDEAALGLALNTATGMITGTPLKAHDMSQTVTVMDGNGGSATHSIQVTITDPTNTDPVFNANAPASITGVVGTAITAADVSATDADGDTLTYSWDVADEAALGLALNTATGMITGTPLKAHDMSQTVTVMDGNGGSATHSIQVTITAVANNPPEFPAGSVIADIIIWKGHAYTTPVLPKATDDEGDDLQPYTITPDLPDGLRLVANDVQDRTITGAAKAASAETAYKFIATDSQGAMAELTFNLTVLDPIKPSAPTSVTAMEEGDLGYPDNIARTINSNKVVVGWVVPVDTTVTSHDPAIPFGSKITGYKVYQNHENLSEVVYPRTDYDDDPIKADATGYKTPVLNPPGPVGTYEFEVAAVNAVGTGAKSDPAADALVANPPSQPRDLRASKVPSDPNSVTLDWLLPLSDGGAPILAYVIYQTLDGGPETEVEIAPAVTHRLTNLDAGRHVFRVAAVNYDGLGGRSEGTEFSVDIPIDPTDPVNVKPTFGNERIDNITATVGTAIDSVTLPAATDPDGDDGDITYSLLPNPAGVGLTFDATTRFLSGTPTRAQSARAYTYTARDARGGTASLNFTLEVAAAAPTVPATANIDSTISLPTMTIPANQFVVLQRNTTDSGIYSGVSNVVVGLANLDHLFRDRGGIALKGPGTAKDLVLSEIMWGSDSSLADDTHSQWIELYNTTKTPLQLSNYMLEFYSARIGATPGAIDEVNSLSWGSLHGQRGRTNGTDTQGRFSEPVEIISMYRKINYAQVKNHEKREEQLKAVPGGSGHGSWTASTRPSLNIAATWRLATPGAQPRFTIHGATSVPRGVIISEIGNSGTDAYDWFELYNTTDSEINLKKWQLSRVTDDGGKGKEVALLKFPDNDNIKIPAKSYLVIAASSPRNDGNDLAAGIDITKSAVNQSPRGLGERGNSTVANYAVLGFSLPNDSKRSLFILRNTHDQLGKPNNIQDVIGTLSIKLQGPVVSGWTGYDANNEVYYNTSLWPLHATGAPHGNVIDGGDEDFRTGKVYQRNNFGGGTGEKHLAVRGYTGVGYDRHADVNAENGGTPGYSKDAVKSKQSELMDQVSISEIMLAIEEGEGETRVPRATRLPQWFEIYNASMVQAVSLNNWYLEIQNTGDELSGFEYTGNLHATLRLPNVIVQPNQTVLVVSGAGLNSGDFPEQRTINLFTNGTYRSELGIRRRGEPVLNPKGFYIQLRDHENNHVDEVGNLGLRHRTGRTGVGRRDEGVDMWNISLDDLVSQPDGHRTALIRIYDRGTPRNGLNEIGGPKDPSTSWVRASDTHFRSIPSLTYFGNHRDYGTPGFRGGGPLPVSLSKFRPERLKDTGEIVVRWATESELNNAGFNILRSETRTGEFTKVHFEAGQGTTSERNTYEWKDTTAKPNVVYYYQIQDVSLDGEVQTLRLSRLKGNVTSVGKATTTWGEIKALQ